MTLATEYSPPTYAAFEAPDIEPTFFFGGQPYAFSKEELLKAGPELVSHALVETRDRLVRLHVYHASGTPIPEDGRLLTREEFVHRATEIAAGLAALSALAVPFLPYARTAVRGVGAVLGMVTGMLLFADL